MMSQLPMRPLVTARTTQWRLPVRKLPNGRVSPPNAGTVTRDGFPLSAAQRVYGEKERYRNRKTPDAGMQSRIRVPAGVLTTSSPDTYRDLVPLPCTNPLESM